MTGNNGNTCLTCRFFYTIEKKDTYERGECRVRAPNPEKFAKIVCKLEKGKETWCGEWGYIIPEGETNSDKQ